MKYSIRLILLAFIFVSCSSQVTQKEHRKLENQVIEKLLEDKIAYQQFIALSNAICDDELSGNTTIFEEKFIKMFNGCTPYMNEHFHKNSKYVKCTAFPRLLNEDSEELKQHIYEYTNKNYKYNIDLTTNTCNKILDDSSMKKTYDRFIHNKKNYTNKLNYENMSSEIDDYLKYGYILIMVE